jgi:hypothetical protein
VTLLANELKNEPSVRVRSNSDKKDNKRTVFRLLAKITLQQVTTTGRNAQA